MRKLGGTLLVVGLFLMIGFAGTDDYQVMQEMNPPLLPLIIKLVICLLITAIGAVLLNRGENHGS